MAMMDDRRRMVVRRQRKMWYKVWKIEIKDLACQSDTRILQSFRCLKVRTLLTLESIW